ncbi:MAG TPA: M48 family metalloprotease [Xanthobacteraceae bacterium]|nr:M48 family metalloprotease [Xanthobacteraceae bacterium]
MLKPGRYGAAALALLAALAGSPATPVRAQVASAPKLPIIRDAEIEQLLREYLTPILKAAGLAQQNVRVVIVNDRSFNAFVVDGRRIFVNAGALLDSETPNQLIGVLAHEVGHIAGGHLARLRQELARMETAALISTLLGIGAVAAGAATGARGDGFANAGIAALSIQPQILQRSLLSYQRSQEESADRAAIRYLRATGQSPKGMYDTFQRFTQQTLFLSQRVDPYTQSHPMPRERLEALSALAHQSPNWNKADSPELQLRHNLMRAKIHGFLDRPDSIARYYPPADTSLPARYARAIAAYRHADLRMALGQIDGLIESDPKNPYFHELKGQALLESGRAREAIAPLRQAARLAPHAMLIRILLGQALVASNDRELLDEAIATLRTALVREPEVPDGFRQLAIAFARKGDRAQADLASAQALVAAGDFKTARELAGRARQHFPVGSPGWVKADDIYSYKPPAPPAGARPH